VISGLVVQHLLSEDDDDDDGWAFARESDDIAHLATAYYSGSYDEDIRDAFLQAAVIYLKNYKVHMSQIPETEDNVKFLFKAMLKASNEDKEYDIVINW
jgi:hypothetical protein